MDNPFLVPIVVVLAWLLTYTPLVWQIQRQAHQIEQLQEHLLALCDPQALAQVRQPTDATMDGQTMWMDAETGEMRPMPPTAASTVDEVEGPR